MTLEVTGYGPAENLPVGKLIGASLGRVFGNFGTFLSLALISLLLSMVGRGLAAYFYLEIVAEMLGQTFQTTSDYAFKTSVLSAVVAPYALTMIAGILFFVAWTRFLLLGERGVLRGSPHRWRRAHWTVLGKGLLLALLYGVVFCLPLYAFYLVLDIDIWAFGFDGETLTSILKLVLLVGLTWLVATTLMLRFSYVLPAAAIGHPYSFAQSWRDTRGQSLRLLGAALLLIVIVGAVAFCSRISLLVFFSILGQILGNVDSMDKFDPVRLVTSSYYLLSVVIPAQLAFAVTFLLQAPVVAFLAHGFKISSGWMNDKELAEQFA